MVYWQRFTLASRQCEFILGQRWRDNTRCWSAIEHDSEWYLTAGTCEAKRRWHLHVHSSSGRLFKHKYYTAFGQRWANTVHNCYFKLISEISKHPNDNKLLPKLPEPKCPRENWIRVLSFSLSSILVPEPLVPLSRQSLVHKEQAALGTHDLIG